MQVIVLVGAPWCSERIQQNEPCARKAAKLCVAVCVHPLSLGTVYVNALIMWDTILETKFSWRNGSFLRPCTTTVRPKGEG